MKPGRLARSFARGRLSPDRSTFRDRGYLQTQFRAFTGSASLAVVLQAILFGIAHGEQGPSAALRIAAYGLAFGILARMRQSLLPGILCHVAIDLANGLSGA